jgi:hypothetical protein
VKWVWVLVGGLRVGSGARGRRVIRLRRPGCPLISATAKPGRNRTWHLAYRWPGVRTRGLLLVLFCFVLPSPPPNGQPRALNLNRNQHARRKRACRPLLCPVWSCGLCGACCVPWAGRRRKESKHFAIPVTTPTHRTSTHRRRSHLPGAPPLPNQVQPELAWGASPSCAASLLDAELLPPEAAAVATTSLGCSWR